MVYDLPHFIVAELSSGPYGPEVTAKIAETQRRYSTYFNGADFRIDEQPDDEHAPAKDYDPTVFKSRKIKRLIDTEAEFMMGKTPGLLIDGMEDSDNQSAAQTYINAVLKRTNFAAKVLRGARDCFIGGRVFLKVAIKGDKITIVFIPADCFVFETDPDDVDILTKVILFYCVHESEDKGDQRWWRQRYRLDSGRCYVLETLYDGYGNIIEDNEEEDTGLDRIPGTVIVNGGLSGDTDGESDVDAIDEEDSSYNQMRSRNMDSLKKSMDPLTYIVGANSETFKGLSRRPGAVNDIQADPVLKGTLPELGQLENSFSYSNNYNDTTNNIIAEMHELLGIPDLRAASVSGLVTSGKGLEALYWPLICRVNEKWTAWSPALEYIARVIIDAAEIYPDLKKAYGNFTRDDAYTVIVETQYALPSQDTEERELDLREVGTGRSVKSYLMKWGGPDHTGLSEEKADEEIAQMVAEKRMFEEAYDNPSGGDLI